MPFDEAGGSGLINDVLLMTGDATEQLRLLPDQSMNACVTSPPYFGLRSYQTDGQIGLERTPSEYVDRLVGVFEEIRRVLRDDGSCWIVIGDSYNNFRSEMGPGQAVHGRDKLHGKPEPKTRRRGSEGAKEKELLGIPWKLAFALSDAGWYRRGVYVWQKPNPMPESTRDRCTMSHEYILHLTKRPTYFHDWYAIAEPAVSDHPSGNGFKRESYLTRQNPDGTPRGKDEQWADGGGQRNARSVWEIRVEASTKIKHTAMFPTRLASRVIRGSTPDGGCCAGCGTPLVRVLEDKGPDEAWQKASGADTAGGYQGKGQKDYSWEGAQEASATKARILAGMRKRETAGWKRTCSCSDVVGVAPAVVLDPFSGAGTSGLCSARLGRDAILIDLNVKYHEMAIARLSDPEAKCLDGNGTRLPFRSGRITRQ